MYVGPLELQAAVVAYHQTSRTLSTDILLKKTRFEPHRVRRST